MSVRNVGIVFSPTLNIPAPVFAMFLTEFDAVFGEEPENTSATPPEVSVTEPLTPEDIRSPRRQMFSEIPTPSYNQDSFPSLLQHIPHPQQEKQPQPVPVGYEQFPTEQDTGLIPLQPSYETTPSFAPYRTINSSNNPFADPVAVPGPEPGAMARKPGADGAAKARRRESSMLLMSGHLGGGQRKSSMPMLRGVAGITG